MAVTVLCITLLSLIVISGFVFFKNAFAPVVFFNALWLSILVFYLLNKKDLNSIKVSEASYFIITIGCFFFSLGTFVFGFRLRRSQLVSYNNPLNGFHIADVRITYYIAFFIIPFLALDVANAAFYYAAGFDMAYIRGIYYSDKALVFGIDGAWVNLFRTYLILPGLMVLRPLSIAAYIKDRKNIKLVILVLLLTAAEVFSSGGRFIIAYFVLQTLFIKQCLIKTNRKSSKKLRLIIVLGVLSIVLVSAIRGVERILKSLLFYFIICVPLLEFWLSSTINHASFCGLLPYDGIIAPLFFILKQSGLMYNYPMFHLQIIDAINATNAAVVIGNDIIGNAFVTAFYYMFINGGYFSLIINMFVYGVLSGFIYYLAQKKNDIYFYSLYSIIIVGFFMSIQMYAFMRVEYYLSIVYILILLHLSKKRLKGKNEKKVLYFK